MPFARFAVGDVDAGGGDGGAGGVGDQAGDYAHVLLGAKGGRQKEERTYPKHELFIPQSGRGVNPGGATDGPVAGQQANPEQ